MLSFLLFVSVSLFLRHSSFGLRVDRLLIVTVITSFCADYCPYLCFTLSTVAKSDISMLTVVASIKETANWYNIPKSFIGLVLLPMMVGPQFLFLGVLGNGRSMIDSIFIHTGQYISTRHSCEDGDEG